MKNLKLLVLAAAVNGVLMTSPQFAFAEDSDTQRLDDLDQQVKVLERKLEIQQEDAAAKAKDTPVVTAGDQGFALASSDGAFKINLHGLVQADDRAFSDNKNLAAGVDTFLLRRVRPIVDGTVYDKYDFRIVPDFGGGKTVIQDAYVEARFLPEARLKAGKFTAQVGLERIQSDTAGKFIERGLPTNLVPNRDIGVQLAGDVLGGALNYAVGIFNGAADGRSSDANTTVDNDNNDQKDAAVRFFSTPFVNSDSYALRGLGFGIAATHVGQDGSATNSLLPSGYVTAGQQTFFTYRTGATSTFAEGVHNRIAPQFYYYYGPLGILGEYTTDKQGVRRINGASNRADDLENKSGQLEVSYLLTGEDASFSKNVNPKTPFVVGGSGWGAFELVARVGQLDIDNTAFSGSANSFADPTASASKAKESGVGVNWYWNKNVKLALNYFQTDFNGGAGTAAAVTDRPTEKVVLTRLQLAF